MKKEYGAEKGKRIFDAISSWWVITHCHRHPSIMKAIKEQTEELDQVIFAGFTHHPAEETAGKLLNLVQRSLNNKNLHLKTAFYVCLCCF